MARNRTAAPNPKRVAAGKRNVMRRKGLSTTGRDRLRQAALRDRPWLHSTGPRSAAGRSQSVVNGKRRQLGPVSTRELKAELTAVWSLIHELRDLRVELAKGRDV